MAGWQIDPVGVQGVLTDVQGRAETLSQVITTEKVQEVLDGLSWGGPITVAVPNAVNLLISDMQTSLAVVSNRITAGLVGVSSAAVAYRDGQQEMADTEDQMMASALSGDVSWFQTHGYLE